MDFSFNCETLSTGLRSMKAIPDRATGSEILHFFTGFTVASQISWQPQLSAILAIQWKIGHMQVVTEYITTRLEKDITSRLLW